MPINQKTIKSFIDNLDMSKENTKVISTIIKTRKQKIDELQTKERSSIVKKYKEKIRKINEKRDLELAEASKKKEEEFEKVDIKILKKEVDEILSFLGIKKDTAETSDTLDTQRETQEKLFQ